MYGTNNLDMNTKNRGKEVYNITRHQWLLLWCHKVNGFMYKSGRNNKLVKFQLYLNHYGYITVQVKGHTTAVLAISLNCCVFRLF